MTKESPTLFRNDINRHISQIVTTRVASTNSPWLAGFREGDLHAIAVSHGEGKFVVNEQLAAELFRNGQVAFQYVDPQGNPTVESPYNPNATAASWARWDTRSATRRSSSRTLRARSANRCSTMPWHTSASGDPFLEKKKSNDKNQKIRNDYETVGNALRGQGEAGVPHR